MKFNCLVNNVHQNAIDHGWYDGAPRLQKEMLMLMISEVAEATEEVRARKPAVYILNSEKQVVAIEALDFNSFTMVNGDLTSYLKPEGEAVELVDCAIRIFDYFGAMKWDFDNALGTCESYPHWLNDYDFGDGSALSAHLAITKAIVMADSKDLTESQISFSLTHCVNIIQKYFEFKGWDFEAVVNIKHEYNKTRPYRHGNKLV